MVSDTFGDFQTPMETTQDIIRFLKTKGVSPEVIIEPTFGTGNFIISALKQFPNVKEVIGVEVQKKYVNVLRNSLNDDRVRLIHGNIFDKEEEIRYTQFAGEILVIGNPPWVTTTRLSKLNSSNTPNKSVDKSEERGLSLITGSSNFDIAESILSFILETYKERRTTIAMLCKATVNLNLLKKAKRYNWKIENWEFHLISRNVFGIRADAGLLFIQTNPNAIGEPEKYHCTLQGLNLSPKDKQQYRNVLGRDQGWVRNNGKFYFVFDRDLYNKYKEIDSRKSYEWRQGVKHDLSDVVILQLLKAGEKFSLFRNKEGEEILIENSATLPFLKGSHIFNENLQPDLYIITTQRSLREDPDEYLSDKPKALEYINRKRERFKQRKSKVYLGRSDLSMFGIGDYSFAPYKVAIASMYPDPKFVLVPPINGKPVLLDDTCYFIGFSSIQKAKEAVTYLNSKKVRGFLESIVFPLDKRKYKIKVLQRVRSLDSNDRF